MSSAGATKGSVDVPALAVPRPLPRERTARLTSPWAVAAVVAVTYLLLVSGGLGRNPYEFVHIGSNLLHQSTSSSVLKPSLPPDRKIDHDGLL